MKILFNRNNSIGIFCLLLLLAVGVVSCIKDEYAENKEKATLTLYFTTTKSSNGASSDGTTIGPELPNEHMRTLRVIVVDKQGKIRYNTKVNVPEDQAQTVINFSELIVDSDGTTTFDVYAIANEEVYAANNEWEGTNINLEVLKNKILDNTILSKLNEGIAKDKYEEGYAVPQTAIQEVTVTPGQENSATIPLEFVVAKVSLSFNNETGKAQTLSDVKIARAKPDKGFLCNDENNETIYIPTDVIYSDVTWSKTVIYAGTEVNPKVYEYSPIYLFPGQNPLLNNGYILSATLNESDSRELEMSSITGLDRGQELKINIRLYKKAVDTHIDLIWEVVDWQKSSNTVPSFN